MFDIAPQVVNQFYSWFLTLIILVFVWKVVLPLQSLTAWAMIVLLVSGILATRLPMAYGWTEVLKYDLWTRGAFYLATGAMVAWDWRQGFPWYGRVRADRLRARQQIGQPSLQIKEEQQEPEQQEQEEQEDHASEIQDTADAGLPPAGPGAVR